VKQFEVRVADLEEDRAKNYEQIDNLRMVWSNFVISQEIVNKKRDYLMHWGSRL
jgi:hypothetical protein